MKVEKLYEGQTFKNYKELCSELEMATTNGKGRDYQFKDLARYCNFTKTGHKITIEEIYPIPLPKIDGRGKDSIYGNLIQLLISDLLAQRKGHVSISRGKLMEAIGMINDNYNQGKEFIKKISIYLGIDERIVYDFYNTTTNSFKSVVETALNSLMDKRVIMYNKIIKVSDKGKFSTRMAKENELRMIMDIERSILDELGYKTMSDVRISKDWNQFKLKTKQLLHARSDIDFYFTAYDITIHDEYIVKECNALVDLLLDKLKRQDSKDELNKLIITNLLLSAQKRHKKVSKSKKMERVRRDFNYINNFEQLINLLIDKNTPFLINAISSTKTFEEEFISLGGSLDDDFDPFDQMFS